MGDDLLMPHQTGGRGNRRKTREEIAEMVCQYEFQIQTTESKTAQSLLFAEIRQLRKLLADKER